jgi:M6 family metalloprotease-like protein
MSKLLLSHNTAISIILILFLALDGTAAPFHHLFVVDGGFKTTSNMASAIPSENGIPPHATQSEESQVSPMPTPVLGILKILVVPVQFSDFSNTTDLETGLTEQILTPLTSYYNEVSYGMVTLQINHLSNWLTLPQTREYYGNDSGLQIDVNWWSFVLDSLNAAHDFVNYRSYGYVLLVHAGNDEAQSGDTLDLWSQASLGKQYFPYDNGVNLGFAILAEKDPYGTFAHEFGHNLKLPDLYDYDYIQQFVGPWSLMDYGNWLNPPSSLMAPEKMWLGWIQPANMTVVNTGQILNITLAQLETPDGVLAVKIPVDGAYYVVEYRREVLTDSALPMEGVILSYVNETVNSGNGPIRVIDAENSSATVRDAAFTSGTGFVDSNNEVAVKVLSLDSENSSIRVQRGFADLVADHIQFVGEILQGENVTFDVYVKNVGVTASETALVSLNINGTEFQRKELPNIDPGSQTVLEFGPWQAEAGLNQIQVGVDVNDDVVEKNKTNNILSVSLDVPEHYVSIDQAVANKQRVDVSSVQQVYFHAKWNDNGSDISGGTLHINGSPYMTNSTGWATVDATSTVVANVSWLVTGVDVQGFHAYRQDAPSPWIVWDVLDAYDHGVSKERCDVNSTQTIWVKIRYAYDGSRFDNSTGSLWIGGQLAEWNEQSVYWKINVSEQTVGQSNYTIPSSFEENLFGLKLMIGVDQASIIWDIVKLTITVKDERINSGATAKLNVNGTYAFDSSVWNGTASFNDTLTKTDVGRFSCSVSSMSDPLYGLTAFESNVVSIIFDRVLLNVTTLDVRINVGETAKIVVGGVYQYDSSVWNGDFVLNDTLAENTVAKRGFSVISISDRNYNLTTFESNSVSVIWDRVDLLLSSAKERISVGSTAPIVWNGKYEYDQAVFEGNVTLNDDVAKNSVGLVHYKVVNVSDLLYGLTNFTTNEISIIFDDLNCSVKADTSAIGRVLLEVNITYQFDGKPVTDANVTVGTVQAEDMGSGRYEASILEWKPYAGYQVSIEKETFEKNLDVSIAMTTNIAIMLLAAIIIAVAILFMMYRKLGIKI